LAIQPPWRLRLDFADMLPAPGQGALGLQIRTDDERAADLIAALNDAATETACRAERAFLAALGGGCRAPIAALGTVEEGQLRLDGMVASPNGKAFFRDSAEGPADEPEAVGRQLAETLRRRGADRLIESLMEAQGSATPRESVAIEIDTRPLAGKRIVVTRDEDADGPMSASLRELGAEPLVAPLIREAGPADPEPLRRAAANAGQYDWIVFSSARGARAFAQALRQAGKSLDALKARTACVGPKTAEALALEGRKADRVAWKPGAEGLLALLREEEGMAGARVLYPRAEEALPALGDGLRAMGCAVDDPVAYRTARAAAEGAVLTLLRAGECDAATFASPSAAEAMAEAMGGDEAAALSERVAFAAIGPTTAGAMRRLGMRVSVEAEERTFVGLARELAAFLAKGK